MKFTEKLNKAVARAGSNLCVGLDAYVERIPASVKNKYSSVNEQVFYFLKEIIEITAPHSAAFKPNLAFFEALGSGGLDVFHRVIDEIDSSKIIIADAKRGDISSTADHYARAFFEQFNVDAITLNPLMGFETLNAFLNNESKAVFVLTLTSNPGASDFLMKPFSGEDSMAAFIAKKLQTLNAANAAHIGMVTGATQATDLADVIRHHPQASLLIPGIGAQGGSVEKFSSLLKNHKGTPLFNSSRGILYAGEDRDNWQKAVEQQAIKSKQQINSIIK